MPSYEMFADFYDSLTDNVEYENEQIILLMFLKRILITI